MTNRKTSWIVVADGARARILANDGPGKGLREAVGVDFIADKRKTSDMVTDQPGRSPGRGGERHALEPRTDMHRHEKQVFAKDLAAVIDRHCEKRDFGQLVLVAPPTTLGDLRRELGKPALALIKAELARDLTKLSLRELPAHLEDVLRL